jgi:hypothetical protein
MVKPFSSDVGYFEHWAQPTAFCSAGNHQEGRNRTHLSVANVGASSIATSADLTKTGVFLGRSQCQRPKVKIMAYRHPGLLSILTTCFTVSSITFGGVMSIYLGEPLKIVGLQRTRSTLVMQTMTGMVKARAAARCSLDIPMRPALAPTIRITQDGDPDVKPYNVVFRYFSCPARSAVIG